METKAKEYNPTITDIQEKELVEKICKKIDNLNKEESNKLLREIGAEQNFLLQLVHMHHHHSGFAKKQVEEILGVFALIFLYYQTQYGGIKAKINLELYNKKSEDYSRILKEILSGKKEETNIRYKTWFCDYAPKWLYFDIHDKIVQKPLNDLKLLSKDKRNNLMFQCEVLILCFEEIYDNLKPATRLNAN